MVIEFGGSKENVTEAVEHTLGLNIWKGFIKVERMKSLRIQKNTLS